MKKLFLLLAILPSLLFAQGVLQNDGNTIKYLWGSTLQNTMDKSGLSCRQFDTKTLQFLQTNKVILTVDYSTLTTPSYATIDSVMSDIANWLASYKVDSASYSDLTDTTFIWQTNGNSTSYPNNKIGTKGNSDLVMIVNNTEVIRLDSLNKTIKLTQLTGGTETKLATVSSSGIIDTLNTVDYSEIVINNTPSDTNNITDSQGINSERLTQTVIIIQGNGGAVDITANPQIADGNIGDIIELWGNDNTNTVKFDDGNGIQLNGGASFTMGVGDNLVLRYMTVGGTTDWFEISRSDN